MALTKSLSFSYGRKRVLISNNSCNLEQFCSDFEDFSPMKKFCVQNHESSVQNDDLSSKSSVSLLESLPQEILIKVVCGVDHDDLKQLFHVSTTVRDAAIIAKKLHFAYSTPSKTKAFKSSIDMLDNPDDFNDYDAPNAPNQARRKNRPRFDQKKLGSLAVALFADSEEEDQRWPRRRSLFMDVDC